MLNLKNIYFPLIPIVRAKMNEKLSKAVNKKHILFYILLAFPLTYLSNLFVLLTDSTFAQKSLFFSFPILLVMFSFLTPLLLFYLEKSKEKLIAKYTPDMRSNNRPIISLTILLNLAMLYILFKSYYLMNNINQDVRFYNQAWMLNKTYLPLILIAYFIIFYFIDTLQLYVNYKIKIKEISLNFLRVALFGIIFSLIGFIVGLFLVLVLIIIGGGGVA